MNVKDFGFFGLFQLAQSEPKAQIDVLKAEEKALYEKIVKDLLRFYSERVEHPNPNLATDLSQQCAVIFRQTKSWKTIEEMLKLISTTDTKIIKWVSSWIHRIGSMRQRQNKIHQAALVIQQCTDRLQNIPTHETSTIHLIQSQILNQKLEVATQRKRIVEHLNAGKRDLDSLENKIAKSPLCSNVVKYMTDYWLHLRVFSDWPEVSLDEEKIAVQVQRIKDSHLPEEDIPFCNLLNSSTKAIFLIKQSGQEETLFEYDDVEPGKIIRTTKIELADKHFAPETPSSKKRSSSMATISDAYIFNTDFAQAREEDIKDKFKDTSLMARKLERVVKLSLRDVNNKLAETFDLINAEASSETSNPLWLFIRLQFFGNNSTAASGKEPIDKKNPNPDRKVEKTNLNV